MSNTILYIFITHRSSFNSINQKIHDQMKKKNIEDYMIITGDKNTYYNKTNKTLFLHTNDEYDGLPEKIIKTFKFISESSFFDKYSHFFKLDEDMIILKKIDECIYKNIEYGGHIQYTEGKRDWHFNRCSKTSHFYNIPYTGPYTPWCRGGYGYIISRISINLIKNNDNYIEHIYEDLYIALLLKEHNIIPVNIPFTKYVTSPIHNE